MEQRTMRWEVQLTGDPTDLQMLADTFTSEESQVFQSGGDYVLRGKTQPLEPMDNVVSQPQHLKKGRIGDSVLGGDLCQGIILEKFADILLDGGSFGVKLPDPPGMGLDKGVVSFFLTGLSKPEASRVHKKSQMAFGR